MIVCVWVVLVREGVYVLRPHLKRKQCVHLYLEVDIFSDAYSATEGHLNTATKKRIFRQCSYKSSAAVLSQAL